MKPTRPNRRSIRLQEFDYSKEGCYFVTICCQHRIPRFGTIENNQMVLNKAGQMIEKWCLKIPEKFPDIEMDIYQIMPDHFHAIVVNTGIFESGEQMAMGGCIATGEHMGSPLREVMKWFKTMTTNEYIRGVKKGEWESFEKTIMAT